MRAARPTLVRREARPRAAPASIALVFAAIALASGCGGSGHDTRFADYSPGPTDAPHRGGTIVLAREEDPDYLDPAMSYGIYSAPVIEAVFRTLLDYDDVPGPDGSKLHPEIAATMPDLREGGTLYAFRIRPDARFGAPLHRHIVAADVKYAIERLFRVGSPGIPFYSTIVGAHGMLSGKDTTIAGLIARGDSLYVRIEKPDPTFLQILSLSFTSPVPREIADRWPNAFTFHTVSTGPYTVSEFVPRRHLRLVRNPDYWGKPAWADTIDLRLGISSINACALIRRGLVDGGFFEVPPAEYGRMVGDSTWRPQVLVADAFGTEYLFMNVRQKPFDDVRVRQAVCWALDREAFNRMYSGVGTSAGEFLPPSLPGARLLGRYLKRDVAKSKALLRAAGYPNGFRTKLYGWTTEPGPRELEVAQQQLADVGIQVELDIGENVGYTAMAEDTSNHIAFGLFGWYADYIDASNFIGVLFDGRRITPTQNLDLSLFDDPQVNAWIDEAARTPDDSLRAAIWSRADARIMDLAPVALMTHRYDTRLWSPRIGGWYRHVTRLLKLESLYVKQPHSRTVAGRGASPGPARSRSAEGATAAGAR